MSKRVEHPAMTAEGRENQLIDLAVDLAEKQLREGTASAQVIVHYLKLASSRERLEQEIMRKQGALMEAKRETLTSAKASEELYERAIEAMKNYGSAT